MEVRLVHAATRGFFFPLVTPRSRLRRSIFTANNRKKNPLAPRVTPSQITRPIRSPTREILLQYPTVTQGIEFPPRVRLRNSLLAGDEIHREYRIKLRRLVDGL